MAETLSDIMGIKDPFAQNVLKAAKAKGEVEAVEKQEKAYGQQEMAKAEAATTEQFAKEREPKELKEKYEKTVDELGQPFIPTQQTAGDLGNIFAMTNILGFLIGGGAKGSAQAALSAQNGMLEGYQKGQQDVYKKQKDIFDENQKALSKAVEGLRDELKRAAETASVNKEFGLAQARQAIANHQAKQMGEYLDKMGVAATYELSEKAWQINEKLKAEKRAEEDRAERRALENARLAEEKRHHLQEEAKQTKGATQQQFVVQRSVNALGGVASAVEALSQLPAGTTVGILPNLTTKDGMINYMRNSAGRSMTSSESKAVETLFTGITRNLAAIEASGAATGLTGLSGQLEKLRPVAGDKAVDVALKMADIRRIAIENVTPLVESGLMPPQQAQVAQQLLQRIEKAIPYTTNEVVEALNPKGKTTIGESAANIARPGKTFETEEQAEEAFKAGTLKSGEKVIIGGRSGTWE